MPHIHGASRDEVLLFPPSLDEYITDDNPVRFIDAFVMVAQFVGSPALSVICAVIRMCRFRRVAS
jgi:hypothetical protein